LRSAIILAILHGMETVLNYRHRAVTNSEVIFIRKFITEHPGSSRRDLSKKPCLTWSGIQANGVLRDRVCCGLMLPLLREGFIALPPARRLPPNPLAQRTPPAWVRVGGEQPLHTSLAELGPHYDNLIVHE